jgi:hypothetical protein
VVASGGGECAVTHHGPDRHELHACSGEGVSQVMPAQRVARNDTKLANTITSEAQAANNAGFTETPSFLLGKTGATCRASNSARNTEAAPYKAAVEKLLNLVHVHRAR